jgi:MoaA/NifB/PqqE/SkfB family radical SAM enzyme
MNHPGHPPAGVGKRRSMSFSVYFAQAPLRVIWEVAGSCELACQHCRAAAIIGGIPAN